MTPDHIQARSCPVCRVALVMSDRQGVEIDYCPQCRGVWLDRGELDKIIERSDAYARRDRDDDNDDRDDRARHSREYDDRRYKKKSFWHELFD